MQVVTKDFAQTLEKSEVDALYSRLNAVKQIEGNPMGVEIKNFGQATAFSVKNIPGPSFNTVKGLSAGDESVLEDIIGFYSNKNIPVRFEITPAHSSKELFECLSEKGFYQQDFHTTLYMPIVANVTVNDACSSISIRKLRNDEFGLFGEIYTKGFQLPAFLKSGVAQNNQVLHGHDNWTFYLACVEKEPAGIGVLYHKDGAATLAAAVTAPDYRRKGVHRALIFDRISQAVQNGCNLVVGQAKFGSVSQNNMERAGLKIAYTKGIWVK